MKNIASAPKSINQLRAGIIGTGFIGPVHIEALRRLGVSVAALCDIPALVHAMAAKHAIPQTFTDYHQLLAAPDIDVVHITAPNRFHKEMSIAAIQAGKHCVCEKPLAMDTSETAQIAKLAKASGAVFAVNYNVRFYPAVLQMRKLVAQGDLGQVIHVNGSYMQDWLFKDTDYNWRLLPKEGGKLRAVADIGTHWMDTASFILGAKIGSVFATLDTFHKTRQRPLGEVQTFSKADAAMRYASYKVETEDFASVLLRFDNGALGNLAVSQVAAGRKNCLRIEIYGSKKSAWWCSEEPEILRFGNRDTANQTALRATPGFGDGAAGFMDYPPGHVEGFPDTFKMLFRSVYGRIASGAKGAPLHATAEDGHQEVAVCEAVMKSNERSAWVDVT
jgi:predicted dehydrogenase